MLNIYSEKTKTPFYNCKISSPTNELLFIYQVGSYRVNLKNARSLRTNFNHEN